MCKRERESEKEKEIEIAKKKKKKLRQKCGKAQEDDANRGASKFGPGVEFLP